MLNLNGKTAVFNMCTSRENSHIERDEAYVSISVLYILLVLFLPNRSSRPHRIRLYRRPNRFLLFLPVFQSQCACALLAFRVRVCVFWRRVRRRRSPRGGAKLLRFPLVLLLVLARRRRRIRPRRFLLLPLLLLIVVTFICPAKSNRVT